MSTKIIICRHGNTFRAGEIPLRVGARTDLPLVEDEKAKRIGRFLQEKGMIPDLILAAPLKRTMCTAEIAMREIGVRVPVLPDERFREIDYGVDENKTEDEVIARIGKQAIDDWNKNCTVPSGWIVDVPKIINNWKNLANEWHIENPEKTLMIVSSNGIIRFAPHILKNAEDFIKNNNLKVSTGGICIFKKRGDDDWFCEAWNV